MHNPPLLCFAPFFSLSVPWLVCGVLRMQHCYGLIFLALGALMATGLRAAEPPSSIADLVLLNGKIWTVNKALPQIEALAIRRDRILDVGRSAQMRALIGPRTRTIDLEGRRVLPGFYDSH